MKMEVWGAQDYLIIPCYQHNIGIRILYFILCVSRDNPRNDWFALTVEKGWNDQKVFGSPLYLFPSGPTRTYPRMRTSASVALLATLSTISFMIAPGMWVPTVLLPQSMISPVTHQTISCRIVQGPPSFLYSFKNYMQPSNQLSNCSPPLIWDETTVMIPWLCCLNTECVSHLTLSCLLYLDMPYLLMLQCLICLLLKGNHMITYVFTIPHEPCAMHTVLQTKMPDVAFGIASTSDHVG